MRRVASAAVRFGSSAAELSTSGLSHGLQRPAYSEEEAQEKKTHTASEAPSPTVPTEDGACICFPSSYISNGFYSDLVVDQRSFFFAKVRCVGRRQALAPIGLSCPASCPAPARKEAVNRFVLCKGLVFSRVDG